jgi:hypothetical protein
LRIDGSVTGACECSLRSRGMVETRLPMCRNAPNFGDRLCADLLFAE